MHEKPQNLEFKPMRRENIIAIVNQGKLWSARKGVQS